MTAADLGEELEVLVHGERVKEDVVLRAEAQTLPHALDVRADVVTVDVRCAATGTEETCQQQQQGALILVIQWWTITLNILVHLQKQSACGEGGHQGSNIKLPIKASPIVFESHSLRNMTQRHTVHILARGEVTIRNNKSHNRSSDKQHLRQISQAGLGNFIDKQSTHS